MKIKCNYCGDVIDGGKKGYLIFCKCGKVAIDETPHYCRILYQKSEKDYDVVEGE